MRPRPPRSPLIAVALLLLALAACGASPGAPAGPAAVPPTELHISTLPAQPEPPPERAEDPPEPRPKPAGAPPFVGTWISDHSLLEMTTTTFHLRFPFQGGTRDNYARILSYDTKLGRVVIQYTRILQDGVEQPVDGDVRYMTYRIDGDVLQKYIEEHDFAEEVSDERFYRSRPDGVRIEEL